MKKMETATLANGCFWCSDAVYRHVEGIKSIKSGFSGGKIKNPAYREVVRGLTDHAEAVQITFDPDKISYKDILHVFFATHDPTTLNRQGHDVGRHYRSVIFYHDDRQKQIAKDLIEELNETTFNQKIVTELTKASGFYEAEEAHQNFYNRHTDFPYCQVVINPKIQKLRARFADKLKKEDA